KRSARMFCTDSLPRKWSMRKTCSSSKTECTVSFSPRAVPRSVPNGFSRMTRPRSARPAPARLSSTLPNASGGARGGKGAADGAAEALLGAGDGGAELLRLGGGVREVGREGPPAPVTRDVPELGDGLAREGTELGVGELAARDRDDAVPPRQQARAGEPEE